MSRREVRTLIAAEGVRLGPAGDRYRDNLLGIIGRHAHDRMFDFNYWLHDIPLPVIARKGWRAIACHSLTGYLRYRHTLQAVTSGRLALILR
jgi:hypothetical protein